MMNKDLKPFYEHRVAEHDAVLSRLRRRNRLFLAAQLTTFAAALAAVVAFTVYGGVVLPVLAVLMTGAYVACRVWDGHNSEQIVLYESLRTVYADELKYLDGDFSSFDAGTQYVNPSHPFTFDLDIFGESSLFHRINRTVTTGGSDQLAHFLSTLPSDEMGEKEMFSSKRPDFIEKIRCRQEELALLAADEPFRTAFMAHRHRGMTDTATVKASLAAVGAIKMPSYASSSLALVVAWLLLGGFFVTIMLAVCTPLPSSVPVIWATLQLFGVLIITNKMLHSIAKSGGKFAKEMKAYESIALTMLRDRRADGENTAARNRLTEAFSAFSSLRRILDGLDRRGNVLGLVLFDVFLLSDFFLVRRFAGWRRRYAALVGEWIEEVSRTDALVSMATFIYNEPRAVRAEIAHSIDIIYEAEALCHPFLGAKAVPNDFTVADGHYYIVTGANMAGKSTFLRSLGVNYVLAMNGMPVFARRLRVSIFSLFSSMRTADDLSRGISYFNAELLRLRSLIDHCSRQTRTLIILDEILKGTNSLDKLNGSRMFLDAISTLPVSGVIATHDLELSRMADDEMGHFHNFCFEISLSDNITYTYKITPGVARNQNATHLLRGIIAAITGNKPNATTI